MPLFCWLFLFAACSKIKDIHFILQRFQKKNFLFFESVEKSFTSVRKCAILYESPIEVWLSLVEHYVRDVGAAGSNPVIPTKNGKQIALLCGLFFLLPNLSRNNTNQR